MSSWLYNPPMPGECPGEWIRGGGNKGYSRKEVKKIAKDAADKTAASWKQYADFQRSRKIAYHDALYEITQGLLDPSNLDEIQAYVRKREREVADKLGLDLEDAMKKFDK